MPSLSLTCGACALALQLRRLRARTLPMIQVAAKGIGIWRGILLARAQAHGYPHARHWHWRCDATSEKGTAPMMEQQLAGPIFVKILGLSVPSLPMNASPGHKLEMMPVQMENGQALNFDCGENKQHHVRAVATALENSVKRDSPKMVHAPVQTSGDCDCRVRSPALREGKLPDHVLVATICVHDNTPHHGHAEASEKVVGSKRLPLAHQMFAPAALKRDHELPVGGRDQQHHGPSTAGEVAPPKVFAFVQMSSDCDRVLDSLVGGLNHSYEERLIAPMTVLTKAKPTLTCDKLACRRHPRCFSRSFATAVAVTRTLIATTVGHFLQQRAHALEKPVVTMTLIPPSTNVDRVSLRQPQGYRANVLERWFVQQRLEHERAQANEDHEGLQL